jgi:beta-galactosidase
VELVYNGKSLGTKQNPAGKRDDTNMILWQDIDYAQGGTLVAIGRNGGKEVARHRIETTGKAVRLIIEPEQLGPDGARFTLPEWKADGMDLQYLTVRAVDSKGRTVPADTSAISISLEGPASLLALDNGDHYTSDLFTSDIVSKRLYQGTLQVVLRSRRNEAGLVRVKAVADNPKLKPASLKLKTK